MLVTKSYTAAKLRGPRLYRSSRDLAVCAIPSLRQWFAASPDWFQNVPNQGITWRDRIMARDFVAGGTPPSFDISAAYPRLVFGAGNGGLQPSSEELALYKGGWTVALFFSVDSLGADSTLFGGVASPPDSAADYQPLCFIDNAFAGFGGSSYTGSFHLNYHQGGSFVLGTNSVGGLFTNTLQCSLISWSAANGVNFSTNGTVLTRQVSNAVAAMTDTRIQIGKASQTPGQPVFVGKLYEIKLFASDLHDAGRAADFSALMVADLPAFGL